MRTNLLSSRLREIRQSLGLSQETFGTLGFVSTPGWVKIENGTRQPSDSLIEKLVQWAVANNHLSQDDSAGLQQELLALKYMNNLSPFVCRLAKDYYDTLSRPNVFHKAKVPVENIPVPHVEVSNPEPAAV